MKIIRFEDVSYEYIRLDEEQRVSQRYEALKGINISVNKGEFVAVLGHNGSGKSTLAKLMNALLKPRDGRVIINGYDTGNDANIYKVRKAAGMVFQNPDNQIIASIVGEDVAFGPENMGVEPKVIRERVESSLKSVGMFNYIDSSSHNLSGGQKQKIAIAGVLAMEPEIIILDEPTAMLDPIGRKDVMKTIKRLNKEKNITVILITHFMDEAVSANRVIVMEDGCVVMDDTPSSIFSQVERIRSLSLDVPQIAELNFMLRNSGFSLPDGILTIKEMTDALCQLKLGT